MNRILIATNNNYKREQFKYLFEELNLKVETLKDYPYEGNPVENKETPEGNAELKVDFWAKKIEDVPILGDDSGLKIDALGGEPGIKARRWGGRFNDDVSDEKWLNYLMERMEGVPKEERTARFKAAWVVLFPDGEKLAHAFDIPFIITKEARNDYPEGSPISAVRYNPEHGKMEMDLTKKKQWLKLKKELESWKDFWKKIEKEI